MRFMPNTLRSLPVSTTLNGEKSFVAYPTPEPRDAATVQLGRDGVVAFDPASLNVLNDRQHVGRSAGCGSL
jgi:hypothetical protein